LPYDIWNTVLAHMVVEQRGVGGEGLPQATSQHSEESNDTALRASKIRSGGVRLESAVRDTQ